jgi:hypothetical protein
LSWHHTARSLTPSLIGCLIIVCDQAYHSHVVGELNDGVGVVRGHTVMGEQGVPKGTKHALLRGPRIEGQRGRCVVAYPYHLGAACKEVPKSRFPSSSLPPQLHHTMVAPGKGVCVFIADAL